MHALFSIIETTLETKMVSSSGHEAIVMCTSFFIIIFRMKAQRTGWWHFYKVCLYRITSIQLYPKKQTIIGQQFHKKKHHVSTLNTSIRLDTLTLNRALNIWHIHKNSSQSQCTPYYQAAKEN